MLIHLRYVLCDNVEDLQIGESCVTEVVQAYPS